MGGFTSAGTVHVESHLGISGDCAMGGFTCAGEIEVAPSPGPPVNARVIMVGNSNGAGSGLDFTPLDLIEASLVQSGWTGATFVNSAVSGRDFSSMTENIATEVTAHIIPDVDIIVLVLETTNTLSGTDARSAIDAAWAYGDLLKTLSPRIRPVHYSVMPRGNGGVGFEAKRIDCNAFGRDEYEDHYHAIVDIGAVTELRIGAPGANDNPMWFQDEAGARVHVTGMAAGVIASLTCDALRAMYALDDDVAHTPSLQVFAGFTNSNGMLTPSAAEPVNGDPVATTRVYKGNQVDPSSTLIQSSAGLEWIYETSGGRPGVVTNGNKVIDCMACSQDGFTVAFLGEWSPSAVGPIFGSTFSGATVAAYMSSAQAYAAYVADGITDSGYDTVASPADFADDTPHVVIMRWARLHSTHVLMMDGTPLALQATSPPATSDPGATVVVVPHLGHVAGGSWKLGAFAFWGCVLSDEECARAVTMLLAMWP